MTSLEHPRDAIAAVTASPGSPRSGMWQARSWLFRKYRVKMVTASVTGAGTSMRYPV